VLQWCGLPPTVPHMKGIVFNLVELAVTEEFGAETWTALLEAANAGGRYENTGDHDDAELLAIVGAASEALGLTPAQVLRWTGERIIPHMAASYSAYFDAHPGPIEFFATLDDTIHWEVLSMYEGAEPPRFQTEDLGDGRAMIEYSSFRGLPDLAEGMIAGVAAHYGTELIVDRQDGEEDGRTVCRFQCAFRTAELPEQQPLP